MTRGEALHGLVPAILGAHVAVPLLFNGVQGNLFSPDNALPVPWSNFLGLFETGVALSLFYGGFARVAAVGLAGLRLAGIPLLGLQPMLDNVLFLGFAAFFFLADHGPLSVDRALFPRLEPPERFARHAVPALRIGLGLSFVFVAFTEKFANLSLAQTSWTVTRSTSPALWAYRSPTRSLSCAPGRSSYSWGSSSRSASSCARSSSSPSSPST